MLCLTKRKESVYHPCVSSKLCECGCGQPTSLAKSTVPSLGYVKGQPVRFRRGHNTRKPRPLCACGCGQTVKASRAKWIKGHDKRTWDLAEPNPAGLCMCGCGQKTALAYRTDNKRRWVKGKPVMFVRGHYGRIPTPVPDENGCWIWQGAKHSHGRGMKGVEGGQELAYRALYRQLRGPIPEGHHLHHTCENPMCVNPDHLTPMTPSEHSLLHAARRSA